MSIRVAGMFGRAWRRQPFGLTEKLARGATWFIVYLVTMAARHAPAEIVLKYQTALGHDTQGNAASGQTLDIK